MRIHLTFLLLLFISSISSNAQTEFREVDMRCPAWARSSAISGVYSSGFNNGRISRYPAFDGLALIDSYGVGVGGAAFEYSYDYTNPAPGVYILILSFTLRLPADFSSEDTVFRVRAFSSDFSPQHVDGPEFFIVDGTVPFVTPFSPENEATGIEVRPTLSWTNAYPTLTSFGYVQVSRDSTFRDRLARVAIARAVDKYTLQADLAPGARYYWSVQPDICDRISSEHWSQTYSFTTTSTVSVDDHTLAIGRAQSVFPNPCTEDVTISFALPYPGHVTLEIFDAMGGEIATLLDQNCEAGYQSLLWRPAGLPDGTYFYRLRAPQWSRTERIVLAR